MKQILSNAKIIGLSLFFPKQKILAISDLHLGSEESYTKQGIFIPRTNFNLILKELEKIFSKTGKIKKTIILGDLKHEFGKPSQQEWTEVIDVLRFISKNSEEIILLKGNHDAALEPIASWENLKIQNAYLLEKESIVFLHGDSLKFFKEFLKAKTIIIGHDHPAVSLREGVKMEKFKCFLKGKYEEKQLIVLPSMNQLSEGSNILSEKMSSPFLKQNLDNFELWVVGDKTYYFGKIKDL
ncbi:MAG: metallophosphoesterase [archaeon]|nr:metallophosphoesterase [archaeon]